MWKVQLHSFDFKIYFDRGGLADQRKQHDWTKIALCGSVYSRLSRFNIIQRDDGSGGRYLFRCNLTRAFLSLLLRPFQFFRKPNYKTRSSPWNRNQTTASTAIAVPNHCTSTTSMAMKRSMKELRFYAGCVAEMACTAHAGRKKHWTKVDRWRTTPNFNAATDARCAIPALPRSKSRAKLSNRWRSGSRKRKVGPSWI